jgi:O-acetyl-ADP-ribose deacetylase (regulator of RNase III)
MTALIALHHGHITTDRDAHAIVNAANSSLRTKLTGGRDRQAHAVREALQAAEHAGIPIQGNPCVTKPISP